jgi:hypothetical protein
MIISSGEGCLFTLCAFSLISTLPNTITQYRLTLVDNAKYVIPGHTSFPPSRDLWD